MPVGDGARLPDELVEPLLGDRAVTLIVDVNAVRRTRRLSIDAHAKAHGGTGSRRTHDEINVATVKAVDDSRRSAC